MMSGGSEDDSSVLLQPERALVEAIQKSEIRRNASFDPRQPRPEEQVHEFLRRHWDKAIHTVVPRRTDPNTHRILEEWFDRLWTMHMEPSRHYHTAVHLQEMICYLELVLQHPNLPCFASSLSENQQSVIRLAIFFHDCIYNVRSSHNEEESANVFEQFASEVNVQVEVATNVLHFIRATQHHRVSPEHTTDLALFLDLDMAVLGKDDNAYRAYAALIRKEYSFVPRDVYCSKRAELLQTFLEQSQIFGTSVMQGALEDQARKNVQNEIDALRNGILHGE